MTQPSGAYVPVLRAISRVLDPYTREALSSIIPILINKEPVTMADITQALADLDAAITGVSDRTAADVATLQAEIATLKAAGVDTAKLQAVADSIEGSVDKLNAIDPVADVPAEPETPAAPAAPAPADPAPAPAPVDPDAPAQQG